MKADDVQTQSVTLSRIDYGPERGRHTAGNLVEMRVRDLDKVGAAMAAVTEAGGNVLSGPNLRVANPERADDAAHAAAYRAARARAEAYADAAGLEVKRVLAIHDSGAGPGPIGYGYETTTTDVGPPPPIAARASPPVRPGVGHPRGAHRGRVRARAPLSARPARGGAAERRDRSRPLGRAPRP